MTTWRREVRAWLEANVPAGPLPSIETPEGLAAHKEWECRLFEAGYAAIHWPKAVGGMGADLLARTVFQEEYERAAAPPRLNGIGLIVVGPTVMSYGTPEQQARYLPSMLSGEELWCQGFSEPDAGSDLAALKTRAVRDGDDYVVNGQKIWTSGGMISQWMLAIVRTGSQESRHRGLSALLVDMSSAGIEARPLRQINGDEAFAEVYFDDVRVPVANLLGEEGDGWSVAMTGLVFERGAGKRTYVTFLNDLAQTLRFAADRPDRAADLQTRAGSLLARVLAYKHLVDRSSQGSAEEVGRSPKSSFNKLYWSELTTDIFTLGMDILGPDAEIEDASITTPEAASWQSSYWYARASKIFAGTNQIQRNLIAEQVLGLPREKH